MIVTTRRINMKPPFTFGIRLMSDLHFGGKHVDYELLKKELDEARANDYRIAINGDVFDGILPADSRRFRLASLPDRLLHAGDRILDEAIDWALEYFRPVARLVDMIGVGNHDDSVLKYHGTDPVHQLVNRLNDYLRSIGSRHQIAYGGYCGWLAYAFYRRRGNQWEFVDSLRIMYHHGAGGSSPVTKGMIDFNRQNVWTDGADVAWKGHKHNKVYYRDRVLYMTPDCSRHGLRDRLNVLTGAYGDEYVGQSQEEVMARGRVPSYAADALMAPQGKGGFVIKVEFDEKNRRSLSIEDQFIQELAIEQEPTILQETKS